MGITLWILLAVPVCLLCEFLVRPLVRGRRTRRRVPSIKARMPARGSYESPRAARRAREDVFQWTRQPERAESTRRRRSYAR